MMRSLGTEQDLGAVAPRAAQRAQLEVAHRQRLIVDGQCVGLHECSEHFSLLACQISPASAGSTGCGLRRQIVARREPQRERRAAPDLALDRDRAVELFDDPF